MHGLDEHPESYATSMAENKNKNSLVARYSHMINSEDWYENWPQKKCHFVSNPRGFLTEEGITNLNIIYKVCLHPVFNSN